MAHHLSISRTARRLVQRPSLRSGEGASPSTVPISGTTVALRALSRRPSRGEGPDLVGTLGHGTGPLDTGRWAPIVLREGRDPTNERPDRFLRLMLVDDHEVVRSGLKSMLEATGDVCVVAEAGTVTDAIIQADRTKPDVIVMDVRLADGSGIEATREIRAQRHDTKVLMLTSSADDEALFASIMAGASGTC